MSSTDRKRSCALAALALVACVALLVILKPGREGKPAGKGDAHGGSPQGDGPSLESRAPGSPAAQADPSKPADSNSSKESASGTAPGAGAIVVRVLDGSTGRPLSGEEIAATLRGAGLLRPQTARTDSGGTFRLEGVAPGAYSLETRHADYLPDARAVELSAKEGLAEVEIPLLPGESLAGAFVDKAGSPVPAVSLALALADGSGMEKARARGAADGTFLLRGLRPGKWSLSALHEGFRSVRREVQIPAPAPLRIELSADPGFLVIVQDGVGRPVGGARVMTLGRTGGLSGGRSSGLTGPDGTLRLHGLPEDAAEIVPIEVKHSGFLPEVLQVSAGDLLGGPLTVTLSKGSELSGRVADARGQPVPNAEVRIQSKDGAFQKTLKTTEAGTFSFRRVPAGSYEVAALSATRGLAVLPQVSLDGTESRSNLHIILQEGAGAVAGRVVDPSGSPVPLCAVELLISPARDVAAGEAEVPGRSLTLRAITGEDGAFRFSGLPGGPAAGRFVLKAGGGKLAAAEDLEVMPGQEDIRLEVELLGSLVGIVSTQGPAQAYTVVLTAEGERKGRRKERSWQFSSSDLWFRIPGVSPGTYTVTVVSGDGKRAEAKGVRVQPGQETGPIQLSTAP